MVFFEFTRKHGFGFVCFCRKGVGTVVQRFDKSLEEFYAICDQIELNLVSSEPLCIFCLIFSVLWQFDFIVKCIAYCLLYCLPFRCYISFCCIADVVFTRNRFIWSKVVHSQLNYEPWTKEKAATNTHTTVFLAHLLLLTVPRTGWRNVFILPMKSKCQEMKTS